MDNTDCSVSLRLYSRDSSFSLRERGVKGGLSMAILKSISIVGSVGRGGRNLPADVKTIQARLNELMGTSRQPLAVDGLNGPKTEGMIADFQRAVVKFQWPDARVDPYQ